MMTKELQKMIIDFLVTNKGVMKALRNKVPYGNKDIVEQSILLHNQLLTLLEYNEDTHFKKDFLETQDGKDTMKRGSK